MIKIVSPLASISHRYLSRQSDKILVETFAGTKEGGGRVCVGRRCVKVPGKGDRDKLVAYSLYQLIKWERGMCGCAFHHQEISY